MKLRTSSRGEILILLRQKQSHGWLLLVPRDPWFKWTRHYPKNIPRRHSSSTKPSRGKVSCVLLGSGGSSERVQVVGGGDVGVGDGSHLLGRILCTSLSVARALPPIAVFVFSFVSDQGPRAHKL